MQTATRTDVYARVTDAIIAELEKGTRPWAKPWHGGQALSRPLRHSDEPYKGVNVLMLWMAAEANGCGSPYWMTFNQARQLGACVRKGEKGTLVVYADRLTRTETDEDGEEATRDIFFMKGYTVFNARQIDGLPERFDEAPSPRLDPAQRIQAADAFFAHTGADIRHGGGRAYYAPGSDHVQMPPFESFRDAESYCATLAHELAHWTGHPDRLSRDCGRNRFGDEGYAREELVAEIAAAFLCCDLGITPEPREDHASYLASWLAVLKADKRAIFQAAGHAQKAAEYLHALQPTAESLTEP